MMLSEDERIDDLGRRGYKIIQNKNKFCFGIDAALLAWFAEIREGEKCMDLCTGTGIVPLLMDARNACGNYVGLELQADMAEMAGRSVTLNHVEDHVRIDQGNLCDASKVYGRGVFDVVTTNPPYMKKGSGIVNPDDSLAVARHEISCTLEDVIRESSALLRDKGRFYMVHRPDRLSEIMTLLSAHKLAPLSLISVHPKPGKNATMILISAVKNGRNQIRILPPVTVYDQDGKYTEQIINIYDDEHQR